MKEQDIVPVTQDYIDTGVPRDNHECALGKACWEHFNCGVHISWTCTLVEMPDDGEEIEKHVFWHSAELSRWVRSFDDGWVVKPIEVVYDWRARCAYILGEE